MAVNVVFVKIGFLGSTPLAEALLDERAVRKDITIRAVSTGCRMEVEDALDVVEKAIAYKPNIILLISPSISQPGPKAAIEALAKTGIPMIVISDTASKKFIQELKNKELGYIIVDGDSMIGARREFLDPVEMAVFNSDIIRILAVTGVFRLLHIELDKVIERLKGGQVVELPRMVVDGEMAIKYAEFSNPYAQVKALACYRMAEAVGRLSVEGCYVVKERERYLPIVTAAHELMRKAALLADEARELEKDRDTVVRKVHFDDGAIHSKTRLFESLT